MPHIKEVIVYIFNKYLQAKRKGQLIIENLEEEMGEVEILLSEYQPYDEQKMYERLLDSLKLSIDSIKKSIL